MAEKTKKAKFCHIKPGKLVKLRSQLMQARFFDLTGGAAEIRECDTSLGEDDCIWLGLLAGHHGPKKSDPCIAATLLDRRLAKWLWPMLKTFAETGRLK